MKETLTVGRWRWTAASSVKAGSFVDPTNPSHLVLHKVLLCYNIVPESLTWPLTHSHCSHKRPLARTSSVMMLVRSVMLLKNPTWNIMKVWWHKMAPKGLISLMWFFHFKLTVGCISQAVQTWLPMYLKSTYLCLFQLPYWNIPHINVSVVFSGRTQWQTGDRDSLTHQEIHMNETVSLYRGEGCFCWCQ